MKTIDRTEFQKQVLQEREKKVLLFFTKENMEGEVEAILKKLEASFPNINIFKIDAEEEKILAFNYQAMELPHLILMERGEVIGSIHGNLSEEIILELLKVEKGL